MNNLTRKLVAAGIGSMLSTTQVGAHEWSPDINSTRFRCDEIIAHNSERSFPEVNLWKRGNGAGVGAGIHAGTDDSQGHRKLTIEMVEVPGGEPKFVCTAEDPIEAGQD